MALGWLIWLAVNTSTQHTKSVNSHTYALFTLFQLWCNRDTYSPRPLAHHSNCLLAAGANRSTSPPPLTTQSPPAAHCLLRHPRARSAQCCWLECGTEGNPWTCFSSAWHQSLVLVNPSNAQKKSTLRQKSDLTLLMSTTVHTIPSWSCHLSHLMILVIYNMYTIGRLLY